MRPYLMIIDDSEDQIELMRAVFKMADPALEILTAQDGDEALLILRSRPNRLPKVILLDLRMPKTTGHEVLAELKADPLLKRIPVCAFSSSDSPKDIFEAYDKGASFYFKKPTGIDQLSKFSEHFRALWFDFAASS